MNEDEQAPHDQPDHHAADADLHEIQARVPQGEPAGEDGGHRELVDHQAGSIVDQALPFEDLHDASRNVEPRQDRRRRYGIRGRHDGAERERGGPGQIRDEELEGGAHRQGGGDHQADGEQPDRPDVRLEIAPRSQQGSLVEDRGQDQHQQELRVELQLRQPRHEPERAAADHQRDRIGELEMPGDPAERHGAQHQEEDHLQQRHRPPPLTEAPFNHAARMRTMPASWANPSALRGTAPAALTEVQFACSLRTMHFPRSHE